MMTNEMKSKQIFDYLKIMSHNTKLMKIRKLVKQVLAYGYYAHYKHDKMHDTEYSSELFPYPKKIVSMYLFSNSK